MNDPRSFGEWLHRERERRAVTLHSIADRTKIGPGLLASLERGDVSRWPGGIYRRAFVRAYAEAIGLDADLVLANFERLFPDRDALTSFDRVASASSPSASNSSPGDAELRLHLASSTPWPSASMVKTACAGVAFALLAGLIGLVAAGTTGFWSATAIAALACHVCGVLGITRGIIVPLTIAVRQWATPRTQEDDVADGLADLPEAQSDPALDLTYYAR
jgi:cytoskeletal protein RodZ